MISSPCAVTPTLYFLSIIMAQVAGQEGLEKSTPLKGKRKMYAVKINGNVLLGSCLDIYFIYTYNL